MKRTVLLVLLVLLGGCSSATTKRVDKEASNIGPRTISSFDVAVVGDKDDGKSLQEVSSFNFVVKGGQEGFYLDGWRTRDDIKKSWIAFNGDGLGFPEDLPEQLREGCVLFGGFKVDSISEGRARIHVVFPKEYQDSFELWVNGDLAELSGATVTDLLGATHWVATWDVAYSVEEGNVIAMKSKSSETGSMYKRFELGPSSFSVGH